MIFHKTVRGRLYRAWHDMVSRCTKPTHKFFGDYGGRGIFVCAEWLKDFETFYFWAIKSGYKHGLYLDRRNNDGPYSPNNCRFITPQEQNYNTRLLYKNNSSGYRGVYFSKSNGRWSCQTRNKGKKIYVGGHKCKHAAAFILKQYIKGNNFMNITNETIKCPLLSFDVFASRRK